MLMKKEIKISIIVATLNNSKFLARCLRSLISQSYEFNKYEIIVINDGSTDNTNEILNIFQEDIVIIDNKKNLGLPTALNKGIKKSKYPYIVRVDSDDYVNFNFLNQLSIFLNMNSNYDSIACDYLLVKNNGNVIKRCNALKEPIGCGILFKKNHLLKIGLYKKNFLLHEDRELMKRYLKKYTIGRLELPIYRYRRHKNNITNDKSIDKKYSKMLKNEISS